MTAPADPLDLAPPPQTTEREIAETLRLRPDPPRVMRLSRKAITVLLGTGGLGLGAILIVALQSRGPAQNADELFSTERVQPADSLAQLPADYGDVPQLGPPLPGDLGRPILSARDRGEPMPVLAGPAALGADPEEQRRLQEIEAARVSALFAEAQTVSRDSAGRSESAIVPGGTLFPSLADGPGSGDIADSREAFLNQSAAGDVVSNERLTSPPSPYVLQAGTVIPAALITGLRSDLPGQITAQVTSGVYDSPSGRYLLIPQGARLLGEYDSRISLGQSRLLLIWTRLILPDGRSITLDSEPGTDSAGTAGLQDRVNNRWGRVLLAAGLATILNLGLETGSDNEDDVARAIRDAAQDTIGRTGDEIVRQQLAVPPTLTIRPGFPVRVMVTRDLILEPLGEVR